MTKKLKYNTFDFGYKHPDYDIKVLNEREARAGAGLLLLFAALGFTNAWFVGDSEILKYFITFFAIDFFIRVLINPHYSPSLVISRLIVSKQEPEYTGAPQKRFAWAIGLFLSIFMFVRIVLMGAFGPLNLAICLLCLTLLFFEAAFGICVGCKMYALITGKKPELCPGGVCKMPVEHEIQKIDKFQIVITTVVLVLIGLLVYSQILSSNGKTHDIKDCLVPDWVAEVGHEDMWRLHNNC